MVHHSSIQTLSGMIREVNDRLYLFLLLCCKNKVAFSDICCSDKGILQETLGPASAAPGDNTTAPDSPDSATARDSLPHVALPHPHKPIKVVVGGKNCDHTALACKELLASARQSARNVPGGVVVFGFDAEWAVWASGVRPVAVIQLSTMEGYTVVFHIKPNENRVGIIPKPLQELLENDDVLLVSERGCRRFVLVQNQRWCLRVFSSMLLIDTALQKYGSIERRSCFASLVMHLFSGGSDRGP